MFFLIPVLFIIIPISLLAKAYDTTISSGSGPWRLTISHFGLVDSGRVDPYTTPAFSNTSDVKADRKLMVSLFLPVSPDDAGCTKFCKVPYMPPATAAAANKQFLGDENANVFDKVEYNTCCATNSVLHPENMNIIILEPAVGTSRLLYGGIAQEIASHGYNVFLLDHPGDASIVEFEPTPGTSAASETIYQSIKLDPFTALKAWDTTSSNALKTRQDDIEFLLKTLTNNTSLPAAILPGFKVATAFDPSRGVGIAGHGKIGGAVATILGLENPELFRYAVNMAGSPPHVAFNDTAAHLVFFGVKPGFQRQDDFAWPDTWKHMQGRITEWDLQNADIFDYTDVPKIVDMAGVAQGKVKGLGKVDRIRAFGATAQFVRAYMSMVDRPLDSGMDLTGLVRFFVPDILPYGA